MLKGWLELQSSHLFVALLAGIPWVAADFLNELAVVQLVRVRTVLVFVGRVSTIESEQTATT